MMGADLLVALTNTSVGLAGATLVAEDRRAGWLLLAPACILLLAYRAYLSERTKHESLEFLYGVARSLSRAPDIESALVDLLRRTSDDVPRRGGRDRAVLGRRQPLRTALDRARARDAHGAARPVARRRAAATSSATTQAPCSWSATRATGLLAHCMEQRGIRQALIAPVPGETRLTGVMVLGDRVGAAVLVHRARTCGCSRRSPTTPGISLEYDRLEQAVTRMRELQERLEVQAFADSLTGLGNRAQFLRRLGGVAAARARRDDGAVPRPRRLQGDQRRARPRGRRRGAGGGRRPDRAPRCAPATSRRGSAATSSRCCSRTSTTRTARRSPSGC